MKKVYLITKGCYSDYHICKATENEELAKKFIKKFGNSYRIEEMELVDSEDELSLNDDMISWRVEFPKYTGGEETAEPLEDYDIQLYEEVVEADGFMTNTFSYVFYMYASDQKTALKIARERYGAVINMGDVFEKDTLYKFPSYERL